MERRGTLVLLLAACLLAGCPQGTAHMPAPGDALSDPGEVLALVAQSSARRQRLIAEARVSYYGADGARKARSVILARRPAAVHFSALSPTDDMVAVLASDGQWFTSFERGSDVCYVGRSCPENLGRFSLFPMAGGQLVDVLVGGVPLIDAQASTVEWDERAGAYRVELTGAGQLTQRIWVAHGTGDVRRIEVRRDGKLQLRLAFEDVKVVAGERLPHTFEMKMPKGKVDLRVKYRDVELNTEIGDDAFQLECPASMRVQTLLCPDEVPASNESNDE